MNAKPWTKWRVCGIFAPDDERETAIREAVAYWMDAAGVDNVLYLHSKARKRAPLYAPSFFLEEMSTRRTNKFLHAASYITPRTVVVFDDVETIRNYPQSMTRNIINHIAPLARFKISAGNTLVTRTLADLYSQFAILDKRVLHANHYWCFAEEHREVSVFDGQTIKDNKDPVYLAEKLRPFLRFNLEPENEAQTALYAALRAAPIRERVQDVSMLRL